MTVGRGPPLTDAEVKDLGKPNAATFMNRATRQTSKQYNQLALDPVVKSVEVMLGKTIPVLLCCCETSIIFFFILSSADVKSKLRHF